MLKCSLHAPATFSDEMVFIVDIGTWKVISGERDRIWELLLQNFANRKINLNNDKNPIRM